MTQIEVFPSQQLKLIVVQQGLDTLVILPVYMSKFRIPNIVLPGEVDEGFRRPGRPKKSFREGIRNNDLKAFQLWPKYIAQKKLIDWSKTEMNGEKQLTQLRKKSRNNGNKQRLIQAMKENKRKSRNVIVFTDPFFMIIIIIINFIFYNCVVIYSLSPPISCMA